MAIELDALRASRPEDHAPNEQFLVMQRARLLEYTSASATVAPAAIRCRTKRSGGRRLVRRWVIVPVAVLFGTATVAYAVVASDDPSPTRVTCQFDSGTTSVIEAVSGDPIADCTDLWFRTHNTDAPPMSAYQLDGDVLVLRAGATPPDKAVAIDRDPAGTPPNTALIELDARLHDYATGLLSEPCIPFEDAVTRIDTDLTDLGLHDRWTIRAETPAFANACGLAFLDPDTGTVVVRGIEPTRWIAERSTPTYAGYRELGHTIADVIGKECVTVGEATKRARAAAESLGFANAEIHTATDPNAKCSRVTVTVTGTIKVVLRGPSHT